MHGLWGPFISWGIIEVPHLRIRETRGKVLVAICDEDLFGKELKKGKLKLDVRRSFYEGKKADISECLKALEDATVANMVGSIVDHAIEAGFVDSKNVIKIGGVPHAQMVRM